MGAWRNGPGITPDQAAEPADEGLVAMELAKAYRRRPVVRGVSLAVRRGEAVGLLGPNGAGKTTTLLKIAGLLRPLGGMVVVDGVPVESGRVIVMRRKEHKRPV